MMQALDGALIKKSDLILKGHTRKKLQATSFIQCNIHCLQKDWCISVNFEISKQIGLCELNDYGVEENANIFTDNFDERKGFVYSQLRSIKVSNIKVPSLCLTSHSRLCGLSELSLTQYNVYFISGRLQQRDFFQESS
jgi:hypothetical protein